MTGFRLQTLYQNAQAAQGISGLGRGTSFSRTHLDDTARKIGLHGFKLRTNQGRGCELSDLAYNGHLATKGSRSVGLPCRGCLWSTSSAPRGCWRERCWVYLFEPFLHAVTGRRFDSPTNLGARHALAARSPFRRGTLCKSTKHRPESPSGRRSTMGIRHGTGRQLAWSSSCHGV